MEEQLTDQQNGAVPGLEALQVFAVGVISATSLQTSSSGDLLHDATVQAKLLQVQNCLTLFSMRYPIMRKCRDIVVELQRLATHYGSLERLRNLVAASELAIPSAIQRLILRD